MRAIKRLILLIIVVAAVLVGFAYSGIYNVAVGTGHYAVTRWYIETVRDNSVESRAEELTVPGDLDNQDRIREGAGHYAQACAGCHGYPGKEPSDHFEPRPPPLYRHADDPDEQFWIVKNGIKMSAMPQHRDHSDEELWNIVAFLQRLPQLSPEEYKALTAGAEHKHEEGSQNKSAQMPELPADPVAAVAAFHQALTQGNGNAALALMHDKATLLENGQIETKQEYAEQHLGADMEFMAQTQSEQVSQEKQIEAQQATVTTRRHVTGHYDSKPVDEMVDESVSLIHTDSGWLITHVQWSPAAK